MAKLKPKVKVIHETDTGLNDRYLINGKKMTNNQAYNKAKNNGIPGYHGVKNADGTRYIRSNPDGSKNNNIEK